MKRIVDGETVTTAGEAMEELPPGAPGVFETLLLRDGAPVFWREHWTRFESGCRWFGFAPPFGEREGERQGRWLAAENGVHLGVLRFAAWRDADRVHGRIEATPPRPHLRRAEFRVGCATLPLPPATPDSAFKHLGRRAWLDALRLARATGDDEVLLCDAEDRVVEAAVSNVFFVRRGRLYTPSLALGPLPGVIRAALLALADARGWSIGEDATTIADLNVATEVWLTNSLVGIRPVATVAGQALPPERPWLEQVRSAWREAYGWDPVVVAPPF